MTATDAEATRRIIDITAGLAEDLVTWPGVVERFERRLLTSLGAGDPMTVSSLQLGAHAGTHVDAPCHFLSSGSGVESVPLDALIGPAYVVDIPPSERLITAAVLQACRIPPGVSRLLTRTRNSGWSRSGDPFREDYVAFDVSGADWCIERSIRLVGVDYLSVEAFDAGENQFPVHKKLLEKGTVIVESLDLAGVDQGAYDLIVLPLLIPGSDGAPARAVLIPERA